MVEVGIPVWHARETLPDALDSLVAQTHKNFIVCLSIDGDEDDYSDIIETYRGRGLHIRVINAKENGGPGVARQRVLDTTQCDYIMFLDSDDMFMPRTVHILYTQAKSGDYDIIRSSFIREEKNKQDLYLPQNAATITWFHGKIYKVKYLKDNDIRFHPDLRTDEDAYFNLVAWNSTNKRGELSEATYVWRHNDNSITRAKSTRQYFMETYMYYIGSQVYGLKKLAELNEEMNGSLVTQTLIHIYSYYMHARFYQMDETDMINLISTLKEEDWLQAYLDEGANWIDIVKNLHAGDIYDQEYVVFYEEPFNIWANRLLRRDQSSNS